MHSTSLCTYLQQHLWLWTAAHAVVQANNIRALLLPYIWNSLPDLLKDIALSLFSFQKKLNCSSFLPFHITTFSAVDLI